MRADQVPFHRPWSSTIVARRGAAWPRTVGLVMITHRGPETLASKQRNWVNWASGILLALGLSTVLWLVDPFGIHNAEFYGRIESISWGAYAVMGVVAYVAYTFFSRPYVEVRDTSITVLNPLRKWHIPVSLVREGVDSFPWASIRLVSGKRIWLLATEVSLRALMAGDDRLYRRTAALSAVSSSSSESPARVVDADEVYVRWSGLDVVQVLLIGNWLVYALLSMIVRYNR